MDSFIFPSDCLSLNERTPFGRHLLPYFLLEPGVMSINHGGFGVPPRVVVQALRHYQDLVEAFPDRWFCYQNRTHQNRVIDEMRQYLDLSIQGPGEGDLVLVRNATFAMNSIFRSWTWKRGDKLLMLSTEYIMTKLAAEFLVNNFGIRVIEVPVEFPIIDADLIDRVTDALNEHGSTIKLAVFAHMSALPAVVMPVSGLVDLCRSRNVPTIIDGAHAVGQIDVSISKLDPDFYIGNGHKWLMTARGVGFLYAKKKWRNHIHPAVITYGYGEIDARREFHFSGNGDYAAYFTIPAALEFRRLLGEQRIRRYCHKLAVEAGELMAKIWNTQVLITDHDQLGAMNNVRVPIPAEAPYCDQEKLVQEITKELNTRCKTYLNIFPHSGQWYARISAQIYNEISDYEMVARETLRCLTK